MDRRSTLSIPAKPDASLAEWTSKIKALQKQVDDDEEVETRRLEAEIAASRQARMRRSTNMGSRTNSIEFSNSAVAAVIRDEDQAVVSDEPLTELQKQRNQDDALRKLMGEDAGPRTPSRSPAPPSPAPASPLAPFSSRRPSSPMSLAAFIGGRATGPRLTKHAPQQDAHDPTQFEQRTLGSISAPHPVFGRGGVAMPGMTGTGKASVVSRALREKEKEVESPSGSFAQRDRRISTPTTPTTPSVRSIVERAQERNREIVPSYTGSSQATAIRQRTISTPMGISPARAAPAETFTTKPKPEPISRPVSHSPNPTIIRPITPRTSTGSKSPGPRPSSSAATHPPGPSTPPPHSSRGTAPLPGLARPLQPTPRQSLGSPQMPPSQNPSPAFLKPPSEKQPTPSLSRLQGRGFVKNIVGREVTSPDSSPTPDRSFTSPGRRQSSVLDRWQYSAGGSATPPPVISSKPIPIRKSFTADPASMGSTSPTTSSYSIPLKNEGSRPVLRSKSSLPSIPTMLTGNSVGASSTVSESGYNGPKLGSAKTVITFVQPTKTGDQPPTASPPSAPVVDELGMRVRTRTISGGLVQERGQAGLPAGAPAGQPLSHPTKDRAKKPRKGKSAAAAITSGGASKLAAIREASPTSIERATLHVSDHERATPSLTPPQTYAPVRTASPISQRSPSPAIKPAVAPKPTLDVDTRPVAGTPGKTSPESLSPLAPPSDGRSPAITPPQSTTQKPPSSPARHSRIPSTGNRATVMDVAQAFTEALQREPSVSPSLPSPVSERRGVSPPSSLGASHAVKEEEEEDYTPPSVKNVVANWGPRNVISPPTDPVHGATNGVNGMNGASGNASMTQTIVAPPLEKRKSSYEKYSAFIMPPLAEERTPVASPAGTLKSEVAPPPEAFAEEAEDWEPPTVGTTAPAEELKDEIAAEVPPAVVPVNVKPVEVQPEPREKVIQLVHDDQSLPYVDIDALYHAPRPAYAPDPDVQTISVEVMAIAGNAATAINKDAHVFYDSELIAVIHRAKVKSSGLVATKVWAWRGRQAQPDEREAQKVQELARRYGTTPASMAVEQAREPPEFVSVLGGTLATRQGTRAHWSPENTAMHIVRSLRGLIYIDELDLGVQNLCSGYSYCTSILETFYVWHGRGSFAAEQRAALAYAKQLAPSEENIVELTEDESQEEEMFWMMLGDGDYANADYWKWRSNALSLDPRIWVVDASQGDVVRPVSSFPAHPEFIRQVYLVDCIWELFVVIGNEARCRRLDIRLALAVADVFAKNASPTRPFTPTIHALVFPTQIPADLLLTFRELHESDLNAGDIPDHMNLIPAGEADVNLKSTSWTYAALQDHTMLPVGVDPSHLR
ncbi:hypothetical protein LXA43DRAFT_1157380 [Ganoderma leucocontextum]|nr:hypothetical protein LXA43DRAFT_1157380 [Ganoderma leucocontextum]